MTYRLSKRSMQRWLFAAGIYNSVWGAWTVLFPNALFDFLGAVRPNYPELWQCIGMIVGVYGVGYLCATLDPLRHWPIVLVGLLGKIFGPIGFIWGISTSSFPPAFGITIVTNDLIWWIPFFLILREAYLSGFGSGHSEPHLEEATSRMIAQKSACSIRELSSERRIALVFLRHNGCTFCRESIGDLARSKDLFSTHKVLPVLVTSGSEEGLLDTARKYGLEEFDYVLDPTLHFYRSFGLPRGEFSTLFGFKELRRAVSGALFEHGVGFLDGDPFQLPGCFIVSDGIVVAAYRCSSASDRPDFCELIGIVE